MLKRLFFIFFILLIGCKSEPPDSDQDGIIDSEDECPELAGSAAYDGCPAYTLTVNSNPSDGGFINPNGGTVKAGQQVSLTATPADEFLFESWSGAETGTSPTISVIIDKNKSITANFVKKKYTLTLEVEGEGEITQEVIKPGITDKYNSGTILKLTANPATYSYFDRWEGDHTGNENPINVTIDRNKGIKAVFKNNIIGEWEWYFYEHDVRGDGLYWDVRDMLAVYGWRDIYIFKDDNSFDWIDGRGANSSSNNCYGGEWKINGTNLSWRYGSTASNNLCDNTNSWKISYDLTFLCDNNVMRMRVGNTFKYYNRKGYDPSTCDIKYKSD